MNVEPHGYSTQIKPFNGDFIMINEVIHTYRRSHFHIKIDHNDPLVKAIVLELRVKEPGVANPADQFIAVRKCSLHCEQTSDEDEKESLIQIFNYGGHVEYSQQTENNKKKAVTIIYTNEFPINVEMAILCDYSCDAIRKRDTIVRCYFCHENNIHDHTRTAITAQINVMVHNRKASRTLFLKKIGIYEGMAPVVLNMSFESRKMAIDCVQGMLRALANELVDSSGEEREKIQTAYENNLQVFNFLMNLN